MPVTPNEPEVYVVDRDAGVRESVHHLIRSHGFAVTGYADAGALWSGLDGRPQSGCVIVRLHSGCEGEASGNGHHAGTSGAGGAGGAGESGGTEGAAHHRPGMALIQTLGQRRSSLLAVGLAEPGDVVGAVQAMRAGAVDVLEHTRAGEHLVDRVREALRRSMKQERRRAQVMMYRERHESLTRRERQVMRRVVDGQLNKEIASDLGLSPKTVEVHRAHMMNKMQTRSLATLVRMAVAMAGPEGKLAE